ncbi:MAG: pilin [Patescibacteria group bacterium]
MKTFTKTILLFSAIFTIIGFFQFTAPEVYACDHINDTCDQLRAITDQSEICNNCSAAQCAELYSRTTGCELNEGEATSRPLPLIIGDLIRALFGFLGIAFLLLIIYGGFLWMTAAGNEENVSKAKRIITQATIGLFIIVIAFAISDFIFDSILEATVSE